MYSGGMFMIEISYDLVSVQDMCFILSNNKGFCDADKKVVLIKNV